MCMTIKRAINIRHDQQATHSSRPNTCIHFYLYMHIHSFLLGKVTALGVLCCFALFVYLTLLASFFLPSASCVCVCVLCVCVWCVCVCVVNPARWCTSMEDGSKVRVSKRSGCVLPKPPTLTDRKDFKSRSGYIGTVLQLIL